MMRKILMSALALGAIITGANADCSSTSCSDVDVTRLYMTNYGTIFIGTSGNESNLNCSAPAGYYLSIRNNDIGKNSLYSMLLTAQTTKKKIDIAIEAGSLDCHILSMAVSD